MKEIYEFDVNVYPRKLWVTYGCPVATLNELFPEGYGTGEPFKEMDPAESAVTYNCRRMKPEPMAGVLLRFRSRGDMTPSNIAHESVHAALDIFNYVDASVDFSNQEPFAYLVGFCVDCCDGVRRGKFGDIHVKLLNDLVKDEREDRQTLS